ncbi:MAG: EAL domain-containing protein, partial [Erythrobacter sp.]
MQNQLIELGQQQLLGALRQSAVLFKQMVIEQIHWLHTFEAFALLGALAVLVIEALFIFLPAQVSVSRTILRLERRGRQLTNSFEAIRDRNAQLVAARNNLTHAANHDALTGLLNRRALYAALADIAPPGAGEVSVSLLKIDLDRFKAINDSLGHKAGDDVLVEVARLLLAHGRQGDLVARIGGDEFVIAVKNPFSVQYLDQLSNRLIRAIGQPMIIDGTSCEIGASVGFTMATSSNATPDQMLIEADLALYKAKHDGRGQVCAYSEGLREAFDDRRRLFDEIGTALANDQFEPHFQPQICMETGQIYGCEILARWRHPERGIIPPATFIAAAEEAGLIRQIDLIMMEKGLNALEAMRTQGIALRAISINASEATLRDPHLPDRLLQEVLSRGLAPGDLTVEILENTLIQNEKDDAIRTVEQLTQTGFSVFLDDFGTGYASMSNLSRLQITGIKLDPSLIAPIPNPRAESIVSALVALSAS